MDTSVGQVHLTSAGTGPTRVVLVPGTGFNAAVTLPWLRVLSARWATTVVDLPGQPGLSDARRPRRDGLAWSGRVLDEVLAGLDVEAIVLVGNSLGAAVALAAGSPRIAARALVSAIPPHRDGCLASRRDLSGWLATSGLQPDDHQGEQ